MKISKQNMSRVAKTILCVTLLSCVTCCQTSTTRAPKDFQKGLNYTAWWEVQYTTPESDRSLANLAATGANWVAIVVIGHQKNLSATLIRRDLSMTPSDTDIAHAIATAHNLGLRVMLKPHVDLTQDLGHWRGDIGTEFTHETQWLTWFSSYRSFINHYAILAEKNGVEQLCIGTELAGTTHRAEDWRSVATDVRKRFSGPITYASNHSGEETSIIWWDAVDYIGIDAYYPLTDKTDPTIDELKTAWIERGYVATMENLAKEYDKPILITEIGYRSKDGAIRVPWGWDSDPVLDLQEQADGYRAALDVLWGQPWLAGIYWWNWDVNPRKGGERDTDYTPYHKPAGEILTEYYRDTPKRVEPLLTKPTATPKHISLPLLQPPSATHTEGTPHIGANNANDLAFDHDGNLWIATSDGLIEWRMSDGTLAEHTVEHGLADNWVETITIAPNGDVWVGTQSGISHLPRSEKGKIDGERWATYSVAGDLACNNVSAITFTARGEMWVSTFECGVSRFDGTTWTTYSEKDGLADQHVLCATVTFDGAVWFGSLDGVSRFLSTDTEDVGILETWETYTTTHGVMANEIRSIALDSTGALWFGTWGGGVSRLSGTVWTSYDADDGVENWIKSILIGPDGTVWAGGRRGVYRFDDATWAWTLYASFNDQPDERGVSMAFAPDDSLWVATHNDGIHRFDGDMAFADSRIIYGN